MSWVLPIKASGSRKHLDGKCEADNPGWLGLKRFTGKKVFEAMNLNKCVRFAEASGVYCLLQRILSLLQTKRMGAKKEGKCDLQLFRIAKNKLQTPP